MDRIAAGSIAVGVGCRRGCPTEEIVALVRAVLAELPEGTRPGGLFTVADKRDEPGLARAAEALRLPITFLDRDSLRRFEGEARTRSNRIEAMFGLPGIAETAALAGAALVGTSTRLLVPRRASAAATCAVAG